MAQSPVLNFGEFTKINLPYLAIHCIGKAVVASEKGAEYSENYLEQLPQPSFVLKINIKAFPFCIESVYKLYTSLYTCPSFVHLCIQSLGPCPSFVHFLYTY